jgi:hypothetical protein
LKERHLPPSGDTDQVRVETLGKIGGDAYPPAQFAIRVDVHHQSGVGHHKLPLSRMSNRTAKTLPEILRQRHSEQVRRHPLGSAALSKIKFGRQHCRARGKGKPGRPRSSGIPAMKLRALDLIRIKLATPYSS